MDLDKLPLVRIELGIGDITMYNSSLENSIGTVYNSSLENSISGV